MKEKLSLLTVLAVLSICLPAQGHPWLGSGTEGDPYLIEDANDMQAIGADSNCWDAHFKLVNDINLADYTGTEFNIIGYFEAFGSPNNIPFAGVFDGNGQIISNFTYIDPNGYFIGLFSSVGSTGRVINVHLVDVNVAGWQFVGGLAGENVGGAFIAECSVAGVVSGNYSYVGGLVGFNRGNISECYSECLVSSQSSGVGGLVGVNSSSGTIIASSARGSVSGNALVGGLLGFNDGGVIEACNATVDVWGMDEVYSWVGGLLGWNNGPMATVRNSCAKGTVSAAGIFAGGLVGRNFPGNIINCYSHANVSAVAQIGGLVANNWGGTIINSYAAGVLDESSAVRGGLVAAYEGGSIVSCFWDIETTGTDWSHGGGEGKTTTEMQKENTFTNAGWDFIEVWNIGENQTHPYLRIYPAGDLNHDFHVDFLDFAILADHWLAGVE